MRKSKKTAKEQIESLNKQVYNLNAVVDEYKLEMAIFMDFFKANEDIHEKFNEFEKEWLDDIRNAEKFVMRKVRYKK